MKIETTKGKTINDQQTSNFITVTGTDTSDVNPFMCLGSNEQCVLHDKTTNICFSSILIIITERETKKN